MRYLLSFCLEFKGTGARAKNTDSGQDPGCGRV